jgi:O-antigen/teichoic acid export membrane protein
MEKQGFLWRWGLVCAVLNVGLDISWIPTGGAVAASWANGLTQAVAALGIWIYVIYLVRVPIPAAFLLKLAGSALVMALFARLVSTLLVPALGLPVGIATGALVFFACLRLTRALDDGDRERLLKVPVPAPVRPLFQRSVQLIAG